MIEQAPGVRRLCVGVAAPRSRLLDRACRTGGSGRLYLEYSQADGIEMGFASSGVDEAMLVTDLVAALRAVVAEVRGTEPAAPGPAVAVFHVGITRLEGDDLGGPAVLRVQELLRDLARVTSADAMPEVPLVVGISAGLFDDISAECGFTEGWNSLAGATAWFRSYGPTCI